MTTPVYPDDEIVHLDAIGQRIMPGDVVWSASNNNGIGARLVVKLTEHKVLVDKTSPKDGGALLVITNLLKGLPDTKEYDGLMSRYGANINYDVKSKLASAPLRFLVVAHNSGPNMTTHISIHEVRGTTNNDASLAIEAARQLSHDQFGDHTSFGSCLWKKLQKHNIGYDRTQGRYLYEDRAWNWTTSCAADVLLTTKHLGEIGILHLPVNEMIPMDEFDRSVSAAIYKYPIK